MTVDAASSTWQRLSGLKPRLRSHVRISRHQYRGRPWYVLESCTSARVYRFSPDLYRIVERMDGARSLDEIWRDVCADDGCESLTQADVLALLSHLRAADALQLDAPPNVAELLARKSRERQGLWYRRLARPLSLRFALLDPDRLLVRALPLVRPLISVKALLVWTVAVATAIALVASHWSALAEHWQTRALDPRNLLLLWLIYPVIKLLHECGHAFTTRAWGGEVHEVGIMLRVLIPVPYVDASSANAFSDKYQRMAVAAAGILVETFLAALAVIAWVQLDPGLLRDIAFNVATIGGISTLLFNGNPLLRYDGYYVLADAIEIPNLASRASRYLGYLVRRYLLGLHETLSPVTAAGESAWFVGYGVAAAAYRVFLTLAIALYVATKLFTLGLLLAVWVLAGQVLFPVARYLHGIRVDPAFHGRRRRTAAVLGVAALIAVVGVGWLPVPSWTSAQGIVRVPEQSLVRAGAEGFVLRLLHPAGQPVQAGAPLLALDDPVLRTRRAVLESRLAELQGRQTTRVLSDRLQAQILGDEIGDIEAELAEVRAKLDGLTVRSPLSGIFMVPKAEDLPGRFVHKGELIGYVLDASAATARVVVPQAAADRVRRHTEDIEFRLAGRPGRILHARMLGEVPSATDHLPSRSLGTQGGGTIAVDARDTAGVKSIGRVFQLDLSLPSLPPGSYFGSRVYVRFEHGTTTLARAWETRLRQLLLTRLQI